MKAFAFFAALFIATSVQAGWGGSCANSTSNISKITGITSLIDPWGQWEATVNSKKISVTLGKDKNGSFNGAANFDGQSFGPMGMTLCDYGNGYTVSISFFEIEFEILSSKQIRLYYEFEGQDTVVLTKVVTKKKKKKA